MTSAASPSISVLVPRRSVNDGNLGKKHALRLLAENATTDYLWMRDDDVIEPSVTLTEMNRLLAELGMPDLLILPLRMTAGNGTLVERLQQAEYAAIQQLTVVTAEKGRAVMCSGANMIVRRDRWLESYNDLHPELPSGDDMFLLESFKRRGLKVMVCDRPDVTAVVSPCPHLRGLLRQRMRWAGKAPHYTDRDILLCGFAVTAANMLQLLCPPLVLLKFPLEYRLIKKRERDVSLFLALLLEVLYPFYMLLCLAGGMLSRHTSPRF